MTRLDCSDEAISSCADPVEKLFKARLAWASACLRLSRLENIRNQLGGVVMYTERLQKVGQDVNSQSLLVYQDNRSALDEAIVLAVQAKHSSLELLNTIKVETTRPTQRIE